MEAASSKVRLQGLIARSAAGARVWVLAAPSFVKGRRAKTSSPDWKPVTVSPTAWEGFQLCVLLVGMWVGVDFYFNDTGDIVARYSELPLLGLRPVELAARECSGLDSDQDIVALRLRRLLNILHS